jgi:hypothetical protein
MTSKSGREFFNSPGRKAGDRTAKSAVRRSIPGLPAWAIKEIVALGMCIGAVGRADDLADTANQQQDIRDQTVSVAQQIDAVVGEFDANGLGGGEDVKTLRAVKSRRSDAAGRSAATAGAR